MAIQYKLKNTNTINEAGNRIYLEDVTGEYSVANPGGYGGINPLRTSMALVMLAVLKTTKGDVVTSLDAYNPSTVNKFNVIAAQDGWYVFQLISLLIYNTGELEEYPLNTILYDAVSGNIVKIVKEEFVNTTKVIEVVELKDSEYVVANTDTLFIANNSKTKLKINTQISNLLANKADFSDKRLIRYKDNYNLVRAVLQGAIYEFCRGNKFVAQKDVEFLNSNNYVLD